MSTRTARHSKMTILTLGGFVAEKKDIKKEVIKRILKYDIDETGSNLDVEILDCYPTTESEL